MDDYKKLLQEVRKNLPEHIFQKERFEIPKVKGHIQGNRTVISNFLQIASTLGREPGGHPRRTSIALVREPF